MFAFVLSTLIAGSGIAAFWDGEEDWGRFFIILAVLVLILDGVHGGC